MSFSSLSSLLADPCFDGPTFCSSSIPLISNLCEVTMDREGKDGNAPRAPRKGADGGWSLLSGKARTREQREKRATAREQQQPAKKPPAGKRPTAATAEQPPAKKRSTKPERGATEGGEKRKSAKEFTGGGEAGAGSERGGRSGGRRKNCGVCKSPARVLHGS